MKLNVLRLKKKKYLKNKTNSYVGDNTDAGLGYCKGQITNAEGMHSRGLKMLRMEQV